MNNESRASGVDLQVKKKKNVCMYVYVYVCVCVCVYIYIYMYDVQETNARKKSQPLQTPLPTNYQQVFKTYLYTFILSTTLRSK